MRLLHAALAVILCCLMADMAWAGTLDGTVIGGTTPAAGSFTTLAGSVTPTGASAARTLANRFSDVHNLKDYGALCDGSTDDTSAIQAWLNSAAAGVALYAPAGQCNFSNTLTIPQYNTLAIVGSGPYQTNFHYVGASTTIDLLVAGVAGSVTYNQYYANFRVSTATHMTAGAAMHFHKLSDSTLENLVEDGFDTGNQYLWDGLWLDGAHVVIVDKINAYTSDNGIVIDGVDSTSNTDVWIDHGYSDFNGKYGLDIAGGIGGVFVDNVEFLGNGNSNTAITDDIVSTGNREVIFGPNVTIDGLRTNANYGIYINDPLSSGGELMDYAFLGSSVLDGIEIVSYPNGILSVASGRLFNNVRDGIRVSDATAIVNIGSQAVLSQNGGYGINATVSTTNITSSAKTFSNTLGDYNSNAEVGSWSPFSPVTTCQSGSGTFVVGSARYYKAGRTVNFTETITETAVGACAGALLITLPTTANDNAVVYGKATVNSGHMLTGQITAGNGYVVVTDYANAYPGSLNEQFIVTGTYESTL